MSSPTRQPSKKVGWLQNLNQLKEFSEHGQLTEIRGKEEGEESHCEKESSKVRER
jgi:hypothetical protein